MSIAERTSHHKTNIPLMGRTPVLNAGDPESKRQEIRRYFLGTWERYESLFSNLASEQGYLQKSIPLRHPLIFYLGHTATFLINKLVLAKLLPERVDPQMESVFAVGVDEMSWDDLNDDHYAWPSVAEVLAYRRKVRATVLNLIDTLPLTLPIDWNSDWWPIVMGIEHENIHLETSSVLIRQQKLEFVRQDGAWQPCRQTGEAPDNELLKVPGGEVSLGKPFNDGHYGWDNEYGHHQATVADFEASRYLVSNGEFLQFVEAGGYSDDSLWSEEGLAWRQFAKATQPTFWVWKNHQWLLRLMAEEVEMPWDWPAETNYHEAKAFCTWKARATGLPIRLPTEDEWQRLYDVAGVKEVPADSTATANLHLDHFASPCPVSWFRQGEFFDVVGNVWQWMETPMYPFPGFDVHPLYDDFTTPTFDNQHNLIKGGSWIACGNETRRSARYAFRRHFFQHAGFRYVASEAEVKPPATLYETDKLLSEYAEFNYGDEWLGVANYPKAIADLAVAAMGERPCGAALDMGCASGRSVFELARHFNQVTGIDFSARFIGQGVHMAEQGTLRYTLTEEAELISYRTRTLKELGLADTHGKVTFWQGDACNLKPQFTGYDLVLASNLLDRLYNPAQFLGDIPSRVNAGGLLVIASPNTWLEEHTPRDKWLGGFKKDGENYSTEEALQELLGEHFQRVAEPVRLAFVIRETANKYQHNFTEVTVWERKG
ncbi:MAG: 5-histidylcysteine sulfoxide synthase [Halomonadaceae bacterium]|nr:MAG: 5-histidylcysteine sulfoxide synthase [Halomonadaceae bacterium]